MGVSSILYGKNLSFSEEGLNIKVVYPAAGPQDYELDIALVNEKIGEDNKRGRPVRILWTITRILCAIATFFASIAFWRVVINYITAKDVKIILLGIIICIAFTVVVHIGILRLFDILERTALRKAGFEFNESYTLSEYVDRMDEDKHADKVKRYLDKCEVLKRSRLLDVQIDIKDEGIASVEFLYLPPDGRQGVADFSLFYESTEYSDAVIVDLSREMVFLPAMAVE